MMDFLVRARLDLLSFREPLARCFGVGTSEVDVVLLEDLIRNSKRPARPIRAAVVLTEGDLRTLVQLDVDPAFAQAEVMAFAQRLSSLLRDVLVIPDEGPSPYEGILIDQGAEPRPVSLDADTGPVPVWGASATAVAWLPPPRIGGTSLPLFASPLSSPTSSRAAPMRAAPPLPTPLRQPPTPIPALRGLSSFATPQSSLSISGTSARNGTTS